MLKNWAAFPLSAGKGNFFSYKLELIMLSLLPAATVTEAVVVVIVVVL